MADFFRSFNKIADRSNAQQWHTDPKLMVQQRTMKNVCSVDSVPVRRFDMIENRDLWLTSFDHSTRSSDRSNAQQWHTDPKLMVQQNVWYKH
ncbi:unnamed protein product [Phytophthora fragariaefolia]|uniref:Unnamed protein product n=1 Tax=Phytophthora fragariaefolia TaxID=1490495 RepID=A0A9W6Y7D7_9STRA|nr:unnamed protein product [Phytophthora fragariaefolia]